MNKRYSEASTKREPIGKYVEGVEPFAEGDVALVALRFTKWQLNTGRLFVVSGDGQMKWDVEQYLIDDDDMIVALRVDREAWELLNSHHHPRHSTDEEGGAA
jgi:hypothetical protein